MKSNQLLLTICLLSLLTFGCSPDAFKPLNDQMFHEEIAAFLPESLLSFHGDGGYYHEIQFQERIIENKVLFHTMRGEVKQNAPSRESTFEVTSVVDSEKLVMHIPRGALNDSDFETIIALKAPIALGHEWHFTAKAPYAKKEKVTAQIIALDADGEWVTVSYTSKSGQNERRTFTRGKGTTHFSKTLVYKNTLAMTGYQHIEDEKPSEFLAIEAVAVAPEIFEFLNAFNSLWVKWVLEGDEGIFMWVEPDSLAAEKLLAVDQSQSAPLVAIDYKVYKVEDIENDLWVVYVAEEVYKEDGDLVVNHIKYDLIAIEGRYLAIDFNALADAP